MLADITIGDLLELLDTEADVHGAARGDGAASYRLLREMGIFGPAAPAPAAPAAHRGAAHARRN